MPGTVAAARIEGMNERETGALALFAFGTLVLFFFVWGSLHDLAHGDEGTLEWTVLAICAWAFPVLYGLAVRVLAVQAKVAWLAGTAFLVSLFSAGAVGQLLHPKYPRDPMLAKTFLAAGIPALGIIGYHLLREALRRRELSDR